MNPSNLEPSRTLDALVAEKVLGKDLAEFDAEQGPEYSTNLEAARALLAYYKPRPKDEDWSAINVSIHQTDGAYWSAEIGPFRWDNPKWFRANSYYNPAHALCLAALKAAGVIAEEPLRASQWSQRSS